MTNYPGFGGIEKVTYYIINYLQAYHGYKITIFSFGTTANELVNSQAKNTRIVFAPVPTEYTNIQNTKALSDLLKKERYDFVVIQDSYAPITHIFDDIEYPWRKRMIVVEHNTPFAMVKSWSSKIISVETGELLIFKLIRNLPLIIKDYFDSMIRHRVMLNNSLRYVLLSESFRSQLKIQSLKACKNVVSISNPLTISPLSSEIVPIKKKQFLFVGRLNFQKGIPFLLQVWREFNRTNVEEWQLVILGGGEEKNRIEETIRKDNIRNIRIDPPTCDVEKYYEESVALLMTSIFEGFGLVLTEAMSRGCIPLAFNTFTSLHDIVRDGKNGFIIKPFDTQKYSLCLKQIVQDTVKREQLSKQATIDSKKFSIEIICDQWMKLFESIK